MTELLVPILALVFFAPLAFIYGRAVAGSIHREAEAKGRSRTALGLSRLIVPVLLCLCLGVRLADPYALASGLGSLSANPVLAAVLSAAEFVGSIALILFFLTLPFVMGRLFGAVAAHLGYFTGTGTSPLRFGVANGEEGRSKETTMGTTPTPPERPLTIAIDGPAAAGKGTLAKRLAAHYSLPYLDTGLLYRAVGRRAAEAGIDLSDPQATGEVARALDAAEIDEASLRGREAGELASQVAVHPPVRAALTDFQRGFAAGPKGAVLDGRDIGTVIWPDASVKIFVTASAEVRARRRTDELSAKGRGVDYERILAEVRERDERDAGRAEAPLKPAPDAHLLDTSEMDIEAAFRAACGLIDRALADRAEA